MIRHARLVAAWLLLALAPAKADQPDPLRVADLLFPESRAWARFEDLPSVPPSGFDAAQLERLRRALKTENGPECPAFAIDPALPLRRAVMLSGAEELIYSGPARCREGAITIVWRAANLADIPPAEELPYRLLRLKPGVDAAFTSHQPGCCGDPMESYNLVGRGPEKKLVSVRSTSMLVLPDGAVEARRERRFDADLVLRVAPAISDDYEPDLSQLMDQAALGNIARKYLPGVAGEQILGFTDAKGGRWSLVMIPREHNVKAYYNFLPTNLGWIAE